MLIDHFNSLFKMGKNKNRGTTSLERGPKGTSDKPNIILVVVDTERADYTNPYGSKKNTTPGLERLSREGITFSNAFSTGPWTVPSMNSIITGLYPSQHGVINGTTIKSVNQNASRQVLSDDAFTLAERLKEIDYATFGFSTNFHLSPRFGFDQGFDHFMGNDFYYLPLPNMMLESKLPQIEKAKPYFVWLHYMDPHFPYVQSDPWFAQWNESPFWSFGDFSLSLTIELYRKRTLLPEESKIPAEDVIPLFNLTRLGASSQEVSFSLLFHRFHPKKDSEHVKYLQAAYMSEIRKTDEAMQVALNMLQTNDRDLIIFTSDHGEELYDHGRFAHQNGDTYQELIHVPLIIRLPGCKHAGKVVDTPVSLIDLIPTILDLLGRPIPDDLAGVSLVPLMEGKKIPGRPLYAEEHLGDEDKRLALALIEYPWKIIFRYGSQRTELYNLLRDPGEQNDLTYVETDRVREMMLRLLKWTEVTKPSWKPTEGVELSPEEIDRLKSMGYLH